MKWPATAARSSSQNDSQVQPDLETTSSASALHTGPHHFNGCNPPDTFWAA